MSDGNVPEAHQPKSVVVDFDGTITEDDLLDKIALEFGDPVVYQQVEDALDAGTMPLRDVIVLEFEPVRATLDEVRRWVLDNARVRRGFGEFVRAARAAEWNVHVVSSGFEELIRPVLERDGVDGGLELHANRVDARPDGWRVEWRYPDECDDCGESCKRKLLPEGYVAYVGDGYSDRCAALAADRVFATRGLATYLDEHGARYDHFEDFRSISEALSLDVAA